MTNQNFWIGGKHAVISACSNNKRKCEKIVLINRDNLKFFSRSQKIDIVDKKFFNKIFLNKNINHQGFAALIKLQEQISLKNLLHIKKNQNVLLLIIDGIEDDRNLGSIIRTSVAFNVDAIIVNKRDFREKSQEMYKSASGGLEYIDIIQVSNLNSTIEMLKKNNVWTYALDSESNNSLYEENFDKRTALVLGSEGYGIKNLVKKNCDKIIKIPINKKIESLNVSNAAAAVLSVLNLKQKKTRTF